MLCDWRQECLKLKWLQSTPNEPKIQKENVIHHIRANLRCPFANMDQQGPAAAFARVVVEVDESVSFSQSVEADTRPRGQRVRANFVIFDFEAGKGH